jgi:hypothetical protein
MLKYSWVSAWKILMRKPGVKIYTYLIYKEMAGDTVLKLSVGIKTALSYVEKI